MPLNYIRLLAGLRGGFQKGIAGWRLRLTRPTKPPTSQPTRDTKRRPAQAQRRRAQPHRRYPSLIIARNRFTVRERSKRRQQSAISV